MKLIYLIGIPGTGKSTVIKELMTHFDNWKLERPIELLDSHISGNVRILGKYHDEEIFSGTDKLSMSVVPNAIDWISTNPDEVIIGEGDRLNNKSFFEEAQKHGDLHIIYLSVSDKERIRRYDERGSEQSRTFIQTVTTKCNKISSHFGDRNTLFGFEEGCVTEIKHESPEDTKGVVDAILELIQ